MAWRRAAEIVAMEAAYRSARKHGKGREFVKITKRSTLRYNALLIVMFTMFSATMGLGAVMGRETVPLLLSMLFVMDIVMGILNMALNLQMLISDRLLDPIYHLPVEDSEVRSLLSWIGFYWGCLLYTSPSPRDRG